MHDRKSPCEGYPTIGLRLAANLAARSGPSAPCLPIASSAACRQVESCWHRGLDRSPPVTITIPGAIPGGTASPGARPRPNLGLAPSMGPRLLAFSPAARAPPLASTPATGSCRANRYRRHKVYDIHKRRRRHPSEMPPSRRSQRGPPIFERPFPWAVPDRAKPHRVRGSYIPRTLA